MDTRDRARELILEHLSVEKGKRRFLDRISKNPTRTRDGFESVKADFERLKGEIEERRQKVRTGGGGNHPDWYKASRSLSAETLAFITLACVLEKLARPRSLQDIPDTNESVSLLVEGQPELSLAKEIGNSCRLEDFCCWLHRDDGPVTSQPHHGKPKGWRWMKRAHSAREVKRRALWLETRYDRGCQFSDKHWVKLGQMLVHVAEDSGLLEQSNSRNTRNQKRVKLRERVLRLIEAVALPYYQHMVHQPLSWKNLDDGGYIDLRMDLVKHWENRSIRDALRNAKLRRVYRAINALQGTQWRINDFVYEVMKGMRSKRQDFPGWPTKEQITKAEKRWRRLEGEANRSKRNEFSEGKEWAGGGAVFHLTSSWGHGCDKKPFKERRRWVKAHRQEIVRSAYEPKRPRALWREAEDPKRFLVACKDAVAYLKWHAAVKAEKWFRGLKLKSFVQRKLTRDRLELAGGLKEKGSTFYFPYQLDFRGRAYAVPRLFHPQSDDEGRGLLEFTRGKTLGKRGVFWLEVHLANLWGHGYDKKPFKERRRWVKAHRQEIVRSAYEPHLKKALWKEAKKPWRFLAACKEYADFLRKGRNFQSHLPIAMDGTCNGFQHLSAMLRDRPGAEATNLLPDISPKDIYTIVMERLRKHIENQAKSHEQGKLARQWRRLGMDRDLVKPGTMTTPYGAKWKTKRDQLADFLLEKKMDTPVLRGDPLKAIELAEYLVSPLDICIRDICKAHSEIEEWLKKVAEALAGRTFYELVVEQMSQTLRRKASGRRDALAARCLECLEKRVTWNIVSDAAIAAAAGRRRVVQRFKSASRDETERLAGYFIDLVGKSVRSVLDDLPECSRAEIAKWLKDGDRKLKALSPRGRPVCWTSPSSFPVVQAKWLYPEERLGSKRLYGEYLYQDKSQPEIGLDRTKQRSGITPNFVHALDAAHMILTVNALRSNKLRDFAVIHDSYAVHACDVDTLNRTLRKTFVDIYRTDVLSKFWEELKCANRGVPELTAVGPPPRQKGNWPIEAVLRSQYFFS